MRVETTYTVDGEDSPALGQGRVMEIDSFVQMYATPTETGAISTAHTHRGYAGFKRIKGNAFREEDVRAFADWLEVLLARAEGRLAALRDEMDTRTDEFTVKAYKGLIGGGADTIRRARDTAADFVDAFEEAAGLRAPESESVFEA